MFQVGPACYRGLWLVDGAFLLEAVTMLGAGREARSGIAYALSQQKPSGAFEVLSPHYFRENGIVLWTWFGTAGAMRACRSSWATPVRNCPRAPNGPSAHLLALDRGDELHLLEGLQDGGCGLGLDNSQRCA